MARDSNCWEFDRREAMELPFRDFPWWSVLGLQAQGTGQELSDCPSLVPPTVYSPHIDLIHSLYQESVSLVGVFLSSVSLFSWLGLRSLVRSLGKFTWKL